MLNSIFKDIRVLKGLLELRNIPGTGASTVLFSKYKAGEEVLNILYSRSYLLSFYSLFNLCLL